MMSEAPFSFDHADPLTPPPPLAVLHVDTDSAIMAPPSNENASSERGRGLGSLIHQLSSWAWPVGPSERTGSAHFISSTSKLAPCRFGIGYLREQG